MAALKKAADADKALGGDARPPWEIDGRRWHTIDRVARNGRAVHWDGGLLARVVDQINAFSGFSPTDWSQRSLVKITGAAPSPHVFFTALTGQEWHLTLKFRVPRNSFRAETLQSQLELRPFYDCSPPVRCDHARVSLMDFPGGVQEVVITVCHDDLNTTAFAAFLERAVAAYRKIGKNSGVLKASELN